MRRFALLRGAACAKLPLMRRIATLLCLVPVLGTAAITTPRQFLGFDVCEDYQLADYDQLVGYWRRLESESDRIAVMPFGKTDGGQDQLVAIISDPANLRDREAHWANSRAIAMARDLNETQAENLAKKAKAIVWIDGGLHATETLATQQLIETAYQLVSRQDEETRRILKDCVILLVHANPDGMNLVSRWYMRRSDPKSRSLSGVPELYQKYAGHDNNRDFYASNLAETRNMNTLMYRRFFPQIVYNHHQSAPAGSIMFIPPFRTPFNYHLHPNSVVATDMVGLHMHQRMIAKGMGGTVMRNQTGYSTWWNGGLRTTTYFHNMIGILTETWGSPNPGPVPFIPAKQVPSSDNPMPVDAGMWHQRQSLAYEIEANYAVLDYASRYRERLLMDTWRAAKAQVERGKVDSWTRYPSRVAAEGAAGLSKPEFRDPKYYILPTDQPDASALQLFVWRLWITGVEVERLTQATEVNGVSVPAGSYLIRCDQPFRPHVLDSFESQDHPNDLQYPGGPPNPPYDNAGYTLAYQMGVRFLRVLDVTRFDSAPVAEPGGLVTEVKDGDSFVWMANTDTASYALRNAGLRLGLPVIESDRGVGVKADSGSRPRLLASIPDGRVSSASEFTGEPVTRAPRIALLDRYGGSMPSGWMRWLFERYGFSFTVLYPPDIDHGRLSEYDVLVVPSGMGFGGRAPAEGLADDPTILFEFRRRMGSLSINDSLPKLREFVENGGSLVCAGTSCEAFLDAWPLGWRSALKQDGRNLPNTKFYIPGSVLRVALNRSDLTRGMGESVDMMFDDDPAFQATEGISGRGPVGYFADAKPLRSGWALGQDLLEGKAAILDLQMGKGKVVLFGPEVNFRGQSHASFKMLFRAMTR